jgi:hypothetical protein
LPQECQRFLVTKACPQAGQRQSGRSVAFMVSATSLHRYQNSLPAPEGADARSSSSRRCFRQTPPP